MLLQLGPSSPAELPAQDPAAPTQSHCYDIFQMTQVLKNAPLACWNKLSTRFMGFFARRFQRQRIQTSWDTDIGNSHLYTRERGQMAARLPVRCSHLDPRKRYIPPLRLSRAHLASGPDVSILFSSLSCVSALPTALLPQPGRAAPWGTYRHHVITLHVGLVIVFTFVVELAEEVECHHSIEINHHGQETDGQDQLGAEREKRKWVFTLKGWWETPRKQESGTKAVTLQMPKERWDQRRKTGFLGEESNDQLLQTKLGPWDSYVEALTLNTSECDCIWRQGL